MKTIATFGFITFIFIPSISYAGEQEKLNKILEYLKLTGYSENISNDNAKCIARLKGINPYIAQRLSAAFRKAGFKVDANASTMLKKRLENEYATYIQTACEPINTENNLNIIAQEYALHINADEISKILDFAKSAAGQNNIFASQQANKIGYEKLSSTREALISNSSSLFSKHVSETASKFANGSLEKFSVVIKEEAE